MKRIIGFVGPICSGKDTAGDYVAEKIGIYHYQISKPLIEEAKARRVTLSRKEITEFGTQLAREKGEHYLAEILLERVEKTGTITGMRQLEQVAYLRNNSQFTLVSVDCPVEIRFQRAKDRRKIVEALTLQEFVHDEHEENSGKNVQRVFECMKLADYHVSNDSNLSSFYLQIDYILRKTRWI